MSDEPRVPVETARALLAAQLQPLADEIALFPSRLSRPLALMAEACFF